MTAHAGGWVHHIWKGSAGDFHSMQPEFSRSVWWCQVEEPTLILGSSQSFDDVDLHHAEQTGIAIVRRRSGGGAVWVHPDDSVWIDITIPKTDQLWTVDVTTSMLWLGEVFRQALLPWVSASVYSGAYVAGLHGRAVCFASASPGELFVGDKKLVGISQRRTRDGSRFQCVLYRSWAVAPWAECMSDKALRTRVGQMSVATVEASSTDIVDAVVSTLRNF